MTHSKTDTYTGIQALRFVAAMMVVFSHVTSMLVDRYQSSSVGRWSTGHAGVDIFFVISGFVMYQSFQPLRARADGWRLFLSRRLIRIVPLYWMATTLKVALVLAVPSLAATSKIAFSHLVASYLFLPVLAPAGVAVPFMPVGWTLNYEMFFYCLCSIALFAAVSPFVFSTIVLSALVVFGFAHEQSAPLETSYTNPIVVEFILGMGVAKLTRGRASAHSLVSCAMIAAGASLILLAEPDPTVSRPFTWGVPAALIVLGAARLEGVLRKVLPRVLLLLGDSSYALYLVHTFVVPVVGLALMRTRWANPWMVLATAAAVSAGVSVAVHKLVERPMTDKLKRLLPVQFRYSDSTLLREREKN